MMNAKPTYGLLVKFSCSLLKGVKRVVIFGHLKSIDDLYCVCFKHATKEIILVQPAKNKFVVGFSRILFPP